MQDTNTAWRIVADAARRMITSELTYLDGARLVLVHRRAGQIPDDDRDLVAFVVIESETDHLPIGDQRAHWSPEALRAREPELARAETWARGVAATEARRLVVRFAKRAGENDEAPILMLLRRRVFFDEYRRKPHKTLPALLQYGLRVTCPCCGYPTLRERAAYEICFLCWWEDDGQDDDTAAEVYGGPNHDYSLRDARSNFERHRVMYPPDRDARIGGSDSPRETRLKRQILETFEQMMRTPIAQQDELWELIRSGEHALSKCRRKRWL